MFYAIAAQTHISAKAMSRRYGHTFWVGEARRTRRFLMDYLN